MLRGQWSSEIGSIWQGADQGEWRWQGGRDIVSVAIPVVLVWRERSRRRSRRSFTGRFASRQWLFLRICGKAGLRHRSSHGHRKCLTDLETEWKGALLCARAGIRTRIKPSRVDDVLIVFHSLLYFAWNACLFTRVENVCCGRRIAESLNTAEFGNDLCEAFAVGLDAGRCLVTLRQMRPQHKMHQILRFL